MGQLSRVGVPGSASVGERDLAKLLRGLQPSLDADRYVFLSTTDETLLPVARMMFREAEGTTLILSTRVARRSGQPTSPAFRRIRLGAPSALDAVGLTAAVAGALAAAGIPANIVAAYHHDHVFVPEAQASAALARLDALSAGAQP